MMGQKMQETPQKIGKKKPWFPESVDIFRKKTHPLLFCRHLDPLLLPVPSLGLGVRYAWRRRASSSSLTSVRWPDGLGIYGRLPSMGDQWNIWDNIWNNIVSHPQIDGKANYHWISRDLLFHLFGDDYIYISIWDNI